MTVGKWNYQTHDYDPYVLPVGVIMLCEDMEQPCPCAGCATIHKFGDMFTSKEIHNAFGLGYPVCNDCHQAEMERYRASRA